MKHRDIFSKFLGDRKRDKSFKLKEIVVYLSRFSIRKIFLHESGKHWHRLWGL